MSTLPSTASNSPLTRTVSCSSRTSLIAFSDLVASNIAARVNLGAPVLQKLARRGFTPGHRDYFIEAITLVALKHGASVGAAGFVVKPIAAAEIVERRVASRRNFVRSSVGARVFRSR